MAKHPEPTQEQLQNAEIITVENPTGQCGQCGYQKDGQNRSYKNYCPLCHKLGALVIHQATSNSGAKTTDMEISCRGAGGCGADFCAKCGKEKISSSSVKLIPADGQITTGASASVNSGTQVKDATFEDCIKRICAATDSIFFIENNAAILFPYSDWMAFTLQKDVEVISQDLMDPNVFEIQYNTDGLYNKVTADWGGTNLQNKKTNTHIRTDGKVTTKEKNNKHGGVTISKQYDSLVQQYGELEKKVSLAVTDRNTVEFIVNALLIQYIREFNNSYKVRTLNKTKHIGGTFFAVQNLYNGKLDVLYLNGYTIRTQKDEPLYIDLNFKYGPQGVEDINDYQDFIGAINNTNGSASTGSAVNATDLIGIGNELASKYTYCKNAGSEDYETMKLKGCGSCWAWAEAIYVELKAKGYEARIVQYVTSYSTRHRSTQYKDQSGNWVDFPYRDTKIDKMAYSTSGSANGKVLRT